MKVKKTFTLAKKVLTSPVAFGRYLVQCLKLYRYNDLLQFANEEQTDKGFPGHYYVRVYDFFLRSRRNTTLYLCEVGLLLNRLRDKSSGALNPSTPSLRMWRKYLPNTHLVGFDIYKFETPHDENCVIIQGDQSSRDDLQKIIDHHPEYDIIIDDALHASPHQQVTFSFLFPYLKSGGLFFIEDLKNRRPNFERVDVPKTLDVLKKFEATGEWTSPLSTLKEKQVLEEEIKEIHFFESWKGIDLMEGASALAVIVKK